MSLRTIRNSLPLWNFTYKTYELIPDWYEHFRDDFDDGVIGYDWMTHGVSAPGRTIIENAPPDKTLSIEVTAGTDARWWGVNNTAPKIYLPLGVAAPCMITTKLNSFNADPPGAINEKTQAGIFIGYWPEGTTNIDIRYAYIWGIWDDDGIGNGFLVVANNATPTAPPHFAPACNLNCLPRCLRIYVLETGEIQFWSVGLADGEECSDKVWPDDWLQHPYVVPATDNYPIESCFVGLTAKHYLAPFNAMEANFENFVIEVYESRSPTEEEDYAPIDVRGPDKFYDGRIQSMSTLKRAVDDKTGLFQISDMNITLKNTDKHFSSLMSKRILKNQEAILYHAWTDEPEDNKRHMITMIVDDYSLKGPDFLVKLKDISQRFFTKKVPADICTEDDYPDMSGEHVGRCKPEVLGKAYLPQLGDGTPVYEHNGAMEAVYVDTTTGKFIAANRPLRDITEVFLDDVQQTEGIAAGNWAWYIDDGNTYIEFVDAGGPPNFPTTDQVVSFNAQGYFRDAWDSALGYIQNPAYVILFYLRFIMGIPAPLIDFPAFDTLKTYYEGISEEQSFYLILQRRKDAMEVLRQMLFSAGAKGWINMDGKFTIARKDVDDWEIISIDHHIFEQTDLFGSPHRKWNLTKAINTINAQYGYIPWQDAFTGAKSEYRDNRYDEDMEDDIQDDHPELEHKR